jgi:hypothetical protein
MKRHLFNLTAAVSLILSLATLALWVRSASRYDQFQFSLSERRFLISSGAGEFGFIRLGSEFHDGKSDFKSAPNPVAPANTIMHFLETEKSTVSIAGIFLGGGSVAAGTGSWYLGSNLGYPFFLFAIAPVIWLAQRFRRATKST